MIGRRPVVIANEIRLRRSQHPGSFVILEGRDDRLFFQQIVEPEICKIVVAENKAYVCEVIRILDQSGFSGAIGLVDSDFDNLEGRRAASPNIVVTELHDIECMQLQSTGLETLISEFGSQPKLDRFGQDIREALLTAARPIGHLRLYSERNQLALRFKDMNYNRIIDRHTLSIDLGALIEEVKRRSNRLDFSDDLLAEGIREIEALELDPWQICEGTDLLGVLSIGLQHTFGSNNAAIVGDERLRQALRLAYRKENFDRTGLSRAIQAWEAQNAPFKILN